MEYANEEEWPPNSRQLLYYVPRLEFPPQLRLLSEKKAYVESIPRPNFFRLSGQPDRRNSSSESVTHRDAMLEPSVDRLVRSKRFVPACYDAKPCPTYSIRIESSTLVYRLTPANTIRLFLSTNNSRVISDVSTMRPSDAKYIYLSCHQAN